MLKELIGKYGDGWVDWGAVAEELARRCPMAPAPTRTAENCSAKNVAFNESSSYLLVTFARKTRRLTNRSRAELSSLWLYEATVDEELLDAAKESGRRR